MTDWRSRAHNTRVGSTFHLPPPPRQRPSRLQRLFTKLGDCALAITIGALLFAVFADNLKVLVR